MSQVTNGMLAALYRQMVYTGIYKLAWFLFAFSPNQQAKNDIYVLVFFFFFLTFKSMFYIFTFFFNLGANKGAFCDMWKLYDI